jgi:hypothetical protein
MLLKSSFVCSYTFSKLVRLWLTRVEFTLYWSAKWFRLKKSISIEEYSSSYEFFSIWKFQELFNFSIMYVWNFHMNDKFVMKFTPVIPVNFKALISLKYVRDSSSFKLFSEKYVKNKIVCYQQAGCKLSIKTKLSTMQQILV